MLVLTADNEVVSTDQMEVGQEVHHGILSFQELKEPDFYFPVIEFLEEFASASITLKIGDFQTVMPLHWSILCTDMEYVQSIPLHEVGGKQFPVFCLNPIDSFAPEFLRLRTGAIYPNTTWTAPQLNDKDLLVVPLLTPEKATTISRDQLPPAKRNRRGPMCAFFSASKFEVYRGVGDIWGDY